MNEFGRNEEELLLYATKYLPDELVLAIKNDPAGWKVKYKSYDLKLNDTALESK